MDSSIAHELASTVATGLRIAIVLLGFLGLFSIIFTLGGFLGRPVAGFLLTRTPLQTVAQTALENHRSDEERTRVMVLIKIRLAQFTVACLWIAALIYDGEDLNAKWQNEGRKVTGQDVVMYIIKAGIEAVIAMGILGGVARTMGSG